MKWVQSIFRESSLWSAGQSSPLSALEAHASSVAGALLWERASGVLPGPAGSSLESV